MAPTRRTILILALALLPGCAAQTEHQKAETDVEITRNIKLKLREDARYQDIQIVCVNMTITLRGRVDNRDVAQDAARVCKSVAPKAQILMRLDIRPR